MSEPEACIESLLTCADIAPDSPVRVALAGRRDILEATAASEMAVLRPRQPGGISHDERAALAARIALSHDEKAMARRFRGMIADQPAVAAITDPGHGAPGGRRIAALVRHADLVGQSPKDATEVDIEALRQAGVEEADIVRLSELIAFLSYQLRLVAGLRLMEASR